MIFLVALFSIHLVFWLLGGMPFDARILLVISMDALLTILVLYSFGSLGGKKEKKPSNKATPDVAQKEKQEAPRPTFAQQVDAIGKAAQFCEESVPQRYRKRIFRRRTLVDAQHTPSCGVWNDGDCTCDANMQTYEEPI